MKAMVMKKAWEIAKEAVTRFGGKVKEYIAEAMRMAWAEIKAVAGSVKKIMENTKEYFISRAETIAAVSEGGDYTYSVKVNDWNNYGKSRTYISIVETRTNSKHYATKKYGYFDNMTNEYVAEKYGDLNDNYTFRGGKF